MTRSFVASQLGRLGRRFDNGGCSREELCANVVCVLAAIPIQIVSVDARIAACVEDRLQMLQPVFLAQTQEANHCGHNVHSSRGLVSVDTKLRADAARHHGFDNLQPVSSMSNRQLKSMAHKARRHADNSSLEVLIRLPTCTTSSTPNPKLTTNVRARPRDKNWNGIQMKLYATTGERSAEATVLEPSLLLVQTIYD